MEPTIEIVDVTPADAEAMLAHNTRNRNVRLRDVAGYARDMLAGDWQFTAEPIKFDTDGVLIDGQHRLLAVVQAGTENPDIIVKLMIVRNLEPEAQDALDTGISRKFHDILRLRGEVHTHQLASIVRLVWMWEYGLRRFNTLGVRPTNPQLTQTLAEHPELRDVALNVTRWASHCGLPASIMGGAYWVFSNIDQDDADHFFERLASETGHMKNDPIYELRRTLSATRDVRGERDRTWLFAITIKAWNAYRKGEPVAVLKYRPGGSKPEKFPEPV